MKRNKLTENQRLFYAIAEKVKKLSEDITAVSKIKIDEIDLDKTDTAKCQVFFTNAGMFLNDDSVDYLADAIKISHDVWIGTYEDDKGSRAAFITLWVRRLRDTGDLLSADDHEMLKKIFSNKEACDLIDNFEFD